MDSPAFMLPLQRNHGDCLSKQGKPVVSQCVGLHNHQQTQGAAHKDHTTIGAIAPTSVTAPCQHFISMLLRLLLLLLLFQQLTVLPFHPWLSLLLLLLYRWPLL